MENGAAKRSFHPSQGWRWRQQRRDQQHPYANGPQSSSVGPGTAQQSKSEKSGRHNGAAQNAGRNSRNHPARSRRRVLARKQYNGADAQRLQKLFLTNRKACVRELLEGRDGPQCDILLETLTSHFQKEYAESTNTMENPPQWLTECLKAGDNPPEWDFVPISAKEVKHQLKRLPGNSAPGPDRLPYKVWKAIIDPSGSILAKILEICRLHKRIPKSWKESTTILLYKKGDKSVPSNWRPISL